MPTFIEKLEDIEVDEENIPFLLKCRVKGWPSPAVQWLHSGKKIPFGISINFDTSINKISQTETEYILNIKKFCANQHTGRYTVVASNLYGEIHSSSQVTLKEIINNKKTTQILNLFVEELVDQTIELGSDVYLQCKIDPTKIDNFNNLHVMWKRENTIIRPFLSRRFLPKFDKNTGIATLNIFSVELLDAGKYAVYF